MDRQEYTKQWYAINPEYNSQYYQEHKPQIREHVKKYRQRIKYEVLNHYSLLNLGYPVCGCCGETNLAKLNIDHIQGNGRAHRRQLGISTNTQFYLWLKNQGYPFGYQTLCGSCNLKKEIWDSERKGKVGRKKSGVRHG